MTVIIWVAILSHTGGDITYLLNSLFHPSLGVLLFFISHPGNGFTLPLGSVCPSFSWPGCPKEMHSSCAETLSVNSPCQSLILLQTLLLELLYPNGPIHTPSMPALEFLLQISMDKSQITSVSRLLAEDAGRPKDLG